MEPRLIDKPIGEASFLRSSRLTAGSAVLFAVDIRAVIDRLVVDLRIIKPGRRGLSSRTAGCAKYPYRGSSP